MHARIAIVTGASRHIGIGAAICRALAADGADIFFTHWSPYDHKYDDPELLRTPANHSALISPTAAAGRDHQTEDGPAALQNELRAIGVRCENMEADLSTVDAPARILAEVRTRLGQPSILVNNATHSERDGYEVLDAAMLDAHYTVNVRGTILLTVEFARRYSGQPGGRIINLVSGQAGPMPGELAYASTKGAIAAFTISLSAELASRGITVNAVDPGPTDTGWMSEELKRELLLRSPQGRIGQPEDAARLIAFLASDAAGWITGEVIRSAGGFR